jgi:hypothetical protein
LPLTNADLLSKIIEAVDVGLRELAAPALIPTTVRFVVRFVPHGCRYFERHGFATPSKATEITFPIVFASIRDVQIDATAPILDHFALLVAHETTHLIQMHPFTLNEATRMTADPVMLSSGHAMGFRVEFEARFVDYCIKQSIVPDGPRRRAFMKAWLDEVTSGQSAWSTQQSDPAAMKIHRTVFETLHKAQGDAFGSVTDEDLGRLFPLCAATLVGRVEPGRMVAASAEETRRGERALAAIRQVLDTPISFSTAYY